MEVRTARFNMHSIRRGAALLEPVVALLVAAAVGVPWIGADTGTWRAAGFVVAGLLAVAAILGLGGIKASIAVLVRTTLAIGLLVLAANALSARPFWLDGLFVVLAVVSVLALPARLAPLTAVLIAAGFGVAALSGPQPSGLMVVGIGAALILVVGLGVARLARHGGDPVPDAPLPDPEGEGILGVAFETAAGGLALLGSDGRIARANQALGDLLGRSAKSMTGTSWWAHLGPEDAAPQEAKFRQLMSGEIWNFHLESRLRTRDRRLVGAVVGMSTIASAAGEPRMAFAQVVNINDRMRNEVRLRQRAAEARRNFGRAPVPMWEVSLAEIEPALERWQRDNMTDLMAHFERHPDVLRHTVSTLDITDANEAAKLLVGADGREEFVRGVRGGRLGPGFVEALGRHLDALWRGKTSDERIIELLDFDGVVHAGMMRMTFIGAEDEDGAASMLVAFTDLADVLEGQQTTGALDARLRAVVSAAPVVLFATDATGLITLWEGVATQRLGHAAGEIVGRSVFEVFSDSQSVITNMRRAIDGDGFRAPDTIGGHAFHTRYSPVFERGRVAGVIGLAIDVNDEDPSPAAVEVATEPVVAVETVPQVALSESVVIGPETSESSDAENDGGGFYSLEDLLPEFAVDEDEEAPVEAEETALEIAPSDLELSELGALLGDVTGEPIAAEPVLEIEPATLEELAALDLPTIDPITDVEPPLQEAPAASGRPALDLWESVDGAVLAAGVTKPVATNRDGSQAKVFGDPVLVEGVVVGLLINAQRHGGAQLTVRVDRLGDDFALSVIDDGPGLPAAVRTDVFGETAAAGPTGLAELRRQAVTAGGELTYDYRRGHSIFTLSLAAV